MLNVNTQYPWFAKIGNDRKPWKPINKLTKVS